GFIYCRQSTLRSGNLLLPYKYKPIRDDQYLEDHTVGARFERKQWKSVYSLHHDRGTKHGAKQEPYWIVIAKATFAALFALLAAGWFIFFISPFFVLFPVVVWWAAFLYYRRQWRTPSLIEFFDLEHVQFVVPAKDAHAADRPVGAFGRVRNINREELPE